MSDVEQLTDKQKQTADYIAERCASITRAELLAYFEQQKVDIEKAVARVIVSAMANWKPPITVQQVPAQAPAPQQQRSEFEERATRRPPAQRGGGRRGRPVETVVVEGPDCIVCEGENEGLWNDKGSVTYCATMGCQGRLKNGRAA